MKKVVTNVKKHFKNALNKIVAEDQLILMTKRLLEAPGTLAIHEFEARKKKNSMRVLVAACSFIFVSLIGIGGYNVYSTPVAYVSFDINPSVELGVNMFDRVVNATGYNADGNQVLKGIQIINNTVDEAISALVESASENGFIANDGSSVISLTSETNDNKTAQNLQINADKGAKNALVNTKEIAAIYKENIQLSKRSEAIKLGITPGKLNLIKKVQALDSKVTVQELEGAKVTDIMKKFVKLHKDKAIVATEDNVSDVKGKGKIETTMQDVNENKVIRIRENKSGRGHMVDLKTKVEDSNNSVNHDTNYLPTPTPVGTNNSDTSNAKHDRKDSHVDKLNKDTNHNQVPKVTMGPKRKIDPAPTPTPNSNHKSQGDNGHQGKQNS